MVSVECDYQSIYEVLFLVHMAASILSLSLLQAVVVAAKHVMLESFT